MEFRLMEHQALLGSFCERRGETEVSSSCTGIYTSSRRQRIGVIESCARTKLVEKVMKVKDEGREQGRAFRPTLLLALWLRGKDDDGTGGRDGAEWKD
jgi:hypothetical protein